MARVPTHVGQPLETGRGEFALAIALGIVLLLLALVVNAALGLASTGGTQP